MPLLAALLGTLFGKLFEFFAQFLTKKIAWSASLIVMFGALTVAYVGAMAALGGTMSSIPVPGLGALGLYAMAADTAMQAAFVCIAADAATGVYRWNRNNLTLLAQA